MGCRKRVYVVGYVIFSRRFSCVSERGVEHLLANKLFMTRCRDSGGTSQGTFLVGGSVRSNISAMLAFMMVPSVMAAQDLPRPEIGVRMGFVHHTTLFGDADRPFGGAK